VTDDLLGKRILFVDDEAGIRLTLAHILGKYGFRVTAVASVDDAMKEIKTHKFDALLSDLNLPLHNEGFVVIRAMRRHQPRCVNFVLTGYPGDLSVEEAVEQQVAHYFTKPVDIHELIGIIMTKLDFCDRKVSLVSETGRLQHEQSLLSANRLSQ
jgi:two-component system response regulator PilR (NtrC family)